MGDEYVVYVNDVNSPTAVNGFRNGDVILNVDGEELDNALDINKYLLVRKLKNVEVAHADGSVETLKLPDSIGDYIFKAGLMPAFTPRTNTQLDTVMASYPAAKAGLLKGDNILAVNGTPVTYFDEIGHLVDVNNEQEATITYRRDNQTKTVTIQPNKDGKLGIYSFPSKLVKTEHKSFGFMESVTKGFSYGYWTLHDYIAQFKYIFTKKGASQLGGFATIGNLFPPVWDWQQFWETTAFISIILAFMNILPIPALDGGHVMFLLYEIIARRKPSDKFMEYAQMIGFFLLIALLLFANGNDIYRAITGK